jgi:hypothetical protein
MELAEGETALEVGEGTDVSSGGRRTSSGVVCEESVKRAEKDCSVDGGHTRSTAS